MERGNDLFRAFPPPLLAGGVEFNKIKGHEIVHPIEPILMIAGRCDWCGETHIYGEKLDQLIAVSVDEKHFRSLWNDSNNVACLKC